MNNNKLFRIYPSNSFRSLSKVTFVTTSMVQAVTCLIDLLQDLHPRTYIDYTFDKYSATSCVVDIVISDILEVQYHTKITLKYIPKYEQRKINFFA